MSREGYFNVMDYLGRFPQIVYILYVRVEIEERARKAILKSFSKYPEQWVCEEGTVLQ